MSTENKKIQFAGSISHCFPFSEKSRGTFSVCGSDHGYSDDYFIECLKEQVSFMEEANCDYIFLEMMHEPERIVYALEATKNTKIPVFVGLSARTNKDNEILSFCYDQDVSFEEIVKIAQSYKHVSAIGVMHSPANIISDCFRIIREFTDDLPIYCYPELGTFKAPNWVFEGMDHNEWCRLVWEWSDFGVFMIGGCCGVGPEDIKVASQVIDRFNEEVEVEKAIGQIILEDFVGKGD